MTAMVGMELEAVRGLAGSFRSNADHLESARRDIDALLGRTSWVGADAQDMRSSWTSHHRQSLDVTAAALREAATLLLEQVRQQELASGVQQGGGSVLDGIVGWVQQIGSGAWDGVVAGAGWVGDRIQDGLQWGADGVDWVVEQFDTHVMPRVTAGVSALGTVVDSFGVLGSQVTRIFTEGRIPQLSELLASGLLVAGSTAGFVGNVVTGQDHGFLAPGEPWAGQPVPAESGHTSNMLDLTDRTMAAYGDTDDGTIRVEAVVGADGVTRYIVSVPGTEADMGTLAGWSHNENGHNWAANLWAIAAGSDATNSQAVMMAIRNSVPPGSEILLTGHSQGGIIAANIAADADFGAEYQVAGVVGYGAPMECADIPHRGPGSVPVLSIQHGGSRLTDPGSWGDIVPLLDLGGSYVLPPLPGTGVPLILPDANPHITSVELPALGPVSDMGANHGQAGYIDSMGSLAPEHAAQVDGFVADNNLDRFFTDDPDRSTVHTVPFGG